MHWILGRVQGAERGAYSPICNPFRNPEAGAKDKQDWMIYFFRGPYHMVTTCDRLPVMEKRKSGTIIANESEMGLLCPFCGSPADLKGR